MTIPGFPIWVCDRIGVNRLGKASATYNVSMLFSKAVPRLIEQRFQRLYRVFVSEKAEIGALDNPQR